MSDFNDLLTPDEAAQLLRVAPATLSQWRTTRRNDDLPFIKLGNRVRYRRADVEAFLRARTSRSVKRRGQGGGA